METIRKSYLHPLALEATARSYWRMARELEGRLPSMDAEAAESARRTIAKMAELAREAEAALAESAV